MMEQLIEQSQRLGHALKANALRLVTAESCTGGFIAQTVTAIPESSQWFERGFVTYSNEAKQESLGVDAQVIQDYGAVSEQCALAMAQGAIAHSYADCAVSVTGIAGPSGGSETKPVGTVWFGFITPQTGAYALQKAFAGDRQAVREQSVAFALQELYLAISESK